MDYTTVRIIYGMPNSKLCLEAQAGKAKLGGCVISMDDPEYFCKDFEHEWNREQAIDVSLVTTGQPNSK